MNIQEIRFLISGLSASENVLTVAGRSGLEYPFVWDSAECAHVRVYKGFDDPAEVARLNAEETDLAAAALPPAWVLMRRFVFAPGAQGEVPVEDATARQVADVLRLAMLRFWKKIDPDGARESFSAEDNALLEMALRPRVEEIFARFGFPIPACAGAAEPVNGKNSFGVKPPVPARRRPGRPPKSAKTA